MKMKKIIAVLLIIFVPIIWTGWLDHVTTKVTGAETHKGMYVVFTEHGTFKNEDNWSFLKWDSSDLQGKVIALKGKEVEICKVGWRVSILSMYENVLSIKTTTKGE